jgi:hypothetical protein
MRRSCTGRVSSCRSVPHSTLRAARRARARGAGAPAAGALAAAPASAAPAAAVCSGSGGDSGGGALVGVRSAPFWRETQGQENLCALLPNALAVWVRSCSKGLPARAVCINRPGAAGGKRCTAAAAGVRRCCCACQAVLVSLLASAHTRSHGPRPKDWRRCQPVELHALTRRGALPRGERQPRPKRAHARAACPRGACAPPGWTKEEVLALKLALEKFGIGRWVQIVDSGVLPGKLIQQLNGQTQRLLGQQSLAGAPPCVSAWLARDSRASCALRRQRSRACTWTSTPCAKTTRPSRGPMSCARAASSSTRAVRPLAPCTGEGGVRPRRGLSAHAVRIQGRRRRPRWS